MPQSWWNRCYQISNIVFQNEREGISSIDRCFTWNRNIEKRPKLPVMVICICDKRLPWCDREYSLSILSISWLLPMCSLSCIADLSVCRYNPTIKQCGKANLVPLRWGRECGHHREIVSSRNTISKDVQNEFHFQLIFAPKCVRKRIIYGLSWGYSGLK